jgi:2-methylaconitate cis-trans-isomerase PrpF
MQTAHRSYMVTGAICTGAAAAGPGTLVNQVTPARRPDPDRLRIAHPYGVMDVSVRVGGAGPLPEVTGVSVGRTARHILDGEVWVPSALLPAREVAASTLS